jgi:hypothetical protein
MKPMTDYKPILTGWGRQAIEHWREFRPDMVAELEAEGRLEQAALDAQEKTKDEVMDLVNGPAKMQFDEAFQMVREKYLFLLPGSGYQA